MQSNSGKHCSWLVYIIFIAKYFGCRLRTLFYVAGGSSYKLKSTLQRHAILAKRTFLPVTDKLIYE
ncbi:hypothetical protein C5167_049956 [Papaver somniferum]|uniref:Uncharacterized protein n=1 Tax=Papaver somniferum TaxID=3469 RepID=A0A4Y7KM99_PAPSO|nr:hypothetical protein C5167_049956 [Papaver somniferum]